MAQRVHERSAPPRFCEVVDAFWFRPIDARPAMQGLMPDGCFDIILEVPCATHVSTRVYRPSSRFEYVPLKANVMYAGVRLHPWIGAPLIDKPKTLPGVDEVLARLPVQADSIEGVLEAIAEHLLDLQQLTPAQRLVREGHAALAETCTSVAELARHLGVSERTLRRAFHEVSGSGPKFAMQLARLRRALGYLEAGVRAIDVAGECGFADQPHLTNELKRLAGVTPAQVLADSCKNESLAWRTSRP